jgi:beta-galactosidase
VHARQLVNGDPAEVAARHPVLVATGLYVVDDATLDWLAAYADAGGHLVLGPRTAYADHEARARAERVPARLSEPAGVWYDEFSNITGEVPISTTDGSALRIAAGAAATRWIDGLVPTDADVLVRYDHPHFGRWPAVTTRALGAGRITYVGTVPNQDLARALCAWLVPHPRSGWRDLPGSVTATTATTPVGRRVHFVHNWSWDVATVTAPVNLHDVLTYKVQPEQQSFPLEPWDVRVFVEADSEDDR